MGVSDGGDFAEEPGALAQVDPEKQGRRAKAGIQRDLFGTLGSKSRVDSRLFGFLFDLFIFIF